MRHWLLYDPETGDMKCSVSVRVCANADNCSLQVCAKIPGAWGASPCVNKNYDAAITKHENSTSHINQLKKSLTTDALPQMVAAFESSEKAAVISALQHVYFLAKNRLPLSLYNSLRDFSVQQGSKSFAALDRKNATYTSHHFPNEALDAIATVIRGNVAAELQASPYFGAMIDDSLDLVVREQMCINFKGLDVSTGRTFVKFWGVVQLDEGTGEKAASALTTAIENAGLRMSNFAGIGTDGGGQMIGKKKGAVARMKRRAKKLLSHHCVNHSLCESSLLS